MSVMSLSAKRELPRTGRHMLHITMILLIFYVTIASIDFCDGSTILVDLGLLNVEVFLSNVTIGRTSLG